MELFILNDVDYTNHILVPSYKVQKEPVTKTWEDATYKIHADVVRWRMQGSFTIYFDSNEELNDFLTNLRNCRGLDNYTDATLFDNESREQVVSRYKFKISLVNNVPYFGVKKHDGYEVQVEEQ